MLTHFLEPLSSSSSTLLSPLQYFFPKSSAKTKTKDYEKGMMEKGPRLNLSMSMGEKRRKSE